ncbi:nucleotidyltransferase domain-containing protein [Nocardia abscessus]|uniref:nucleotidyltransferase domain-containing protein n=1 Tax=Nocardia abscessus TaxID=120957 RepID=UPI001894F4F7|nr:nucleotidyltransferase domain-containing protein [Nocardia abscessus]MBF6340829.1 nucleotidyltransferase domain-containing protein [Nocardia abscessus]
MRTEFGDELIVLRRDVLSTRAVRNAYLGYVTDQLDKLVRRGRQDTDSSDRRREKHARHVARLLIQGFQLYSTGERTVRVQDRDRIMGIGEQVMSDPEATALRHLLAQNERGFNAAKSPLPERPETDRLDDLMRRIRIADLKGQLPA